MSKYIKLEDALKGLNIGYGKYDYVSKVAEYYYDLPTIDIVRCKDCKYSHVYILDSNEEPQRWCKIGLAKAVDDDDYCSWGE